MQAVLPAHRCSYRKLLPRKRWLSASRPSAHFCTACSFASRRCRSLLPHTAGVADHRPCKSSATARPTSERRMHPRHHPHLDHHLQNLDQLGHRYKRPARCEKLQFVGGWLRTEEIHYPQRNLFKPAGSNTQTRAGIAFLTANQSVFHQQLQILCLSAFSHHLVATPRLQLNLCRT